MDSIDYYERQGSQYFEETIDLDMTDHLRRFLDRLPENAEVLDLGWQKAIFPFCQLIQFSDNIVR